MIALVQLTEELCGAIFQRTGVPAYADRLHTAVYPMYFLTLTPEESVLTAGGDQVLRKVAVNVACHGSRQRENAEGLELVHLLADALLPGLPLCGRYLTPVRLECRTKENRPEVCFRLEFYDLAEFHADDVTTTGTSCQN